MKTYLINTLSKISTTGQHLDFISTLKRYEWVVFNEDKTNIEKLLFFNDNRLLVSLNGKTLESKWEFIKVGSSILINDEPSKYLFNVIACTKDIILLNIDSTDNYSFLINSSSKSLEDPTYEDIQWYLFYECNIDFLTPEQRKQYEEELKIEKEEKEKMDKAEGEELAKVIFAFFIFLSIILFCIGFINLDK